MTAVTASSSPDLISKGSLGIEIRALLLLAGPLVLGNLAQMAIHTTEVIILGRYDVQALAAAALAVNLYFACGTFGMGLMTAASPMIAAERGRRKSSVRDIRRTVRQGFWVALTVCVPIWAVLWNSEKLFLLMGQQPICRVMRGNSCAWRCGVCCPGCCSSCCACMCPRSNGRSGA
jgi:MATE family multidrug resistance protein